MRAGPHLRQLWIGLLLALLGSSALWAMAQEDSAPATSAQAQQMQDGLRQLGGQIARLRQSSVQADQTLIGQGRAVQKQIEGIEHSQARLGEQLQALHAANQQHLEQWQASQRRLGWALWGIAGLTLLIAVLMARLWGVKRASTAPQPVAPSVLPVQPAPPETPAPPVPQPAPQAEPVNADTQAPAPLAPIATDGASALGAADTASADTAAAAAAAAAAEPAPSTPALVPAATSNTSASAHEPAPWAALLAADLNHTEQALAQARQGFMQPVRIEP